MEIDTFHDWTKIGKKRSENQITGESGIDILRALLPVEWVIREYTADYGIDLDVELFEKCSEKVYITKGEHVLFQVKTTNSLNVKTMKILSDDMSNNEFYTFRVAKYSLDTDLLSTVERMGSAVPVLLCLVDNVEREGYFVCLNDYIDKILVPQNPDYHMQESVVINIPIENRISDGKRVIEWYGKRAKLYSFFNIISSQNRDLHYISAVDLEKKIDIFLKKICRLDIWSDNMLYMYKKMINYYLKYHSTVEAERRIKNAIEDGENVDDPIWESAYYVGAVSFRQAVKIEELHRLWDHLCLIGDMYEADYRESYLPTEYWAIINE